MLGTKMHMNSLMVPLGGCIGTKMGGKNAGLNFDQFLDQMRESGRVCHVPKGKNASLQACKLQACKLQDAGCKGQGHGKVQVALAMAIAKCQWSWL